ncbi:hypothetical protein QVD17_35991 [Tagetes erecta]|uniref:Uncharacterized protein n=1 Tax=Tagetes erecta TaxID=13708 RepID=A0AAD8JXP3_TARER|nr:hypothetical protein QVD17_35991 [Tagetes erecta]
MYFQVLCWENMFPAIMVEIVMIFGIELLTFFTFINHKSVGEGTIGTCNSECVSVCQLFIFVQCLSKYFLRASHVMIMT